MATDTTASRLAPTFRTMKPSGANRSRSGQAGGPPRGPPKRDGSEDERPLRRRGEKLEEAPAGGRRGRRGDGGREREKRSRQRPREHEEALHPPGAGGGAEGHRAGRP